MKTVNSIDSSTTPRPGHAPRNGAQTLRRKSASKFVKSTDSGKPEQPKDSLLLTTQMAMERLGCHWQTLLYREKRGELNAIKIGRRKYYSAGQIDLVKKNNPVHSKPHWSKRPQRPGGGPGSGMIIGCALVSHQKPTLWNRIKTAIASFVK